MDSNDNNEEFKSIIEDAFFAADNESLVNWSVALEDVPEKREIIVYLERAGYEPQKWIIRFEQIE